MRIEQLVVVDIVVNVEGYNLGLGEVHLVEHVAVLLVERLAEVFEGVIRENLHLKLFAIQHQGYVEGLALVALLALCDGAQRLLHILELLVACHILHLQLPHHFCNLFNILVLNEGANRNQEVIVIVDIPRIKFLTTACWHLAFLPA